MDFNVVEAVRSRRSVRSFDGVALSEEDRRAVIDYVNNIMTPFSVPLCFRMLDHAGAERNEKLDTKGIVTGTELYLAITVPKSAPMNLEAAGYAFEQLVLYAASRGIGTTIIAGTMDRVGFERAVHLAADEVMPVMTPLGRAGKPTLRERAMRRAIKADSRRDWSELFFDGDFSTPLSKEAAGAYQEALECVRLAPSAVNAQPWLVLREGKSFHFFERHGRGFGKDPAADIQRVDMGIACCHFDLAAQEAGLHGHWEHRPPALSLPENTDYCISYIAEE